MTSSISTMATSLVSSSPSLPSRSQRDIHSITPYQQMISSCTGAFLTSIFVTPLDVVKIRLQSQQKDFMRNKCFVYCNGLMDHLCCMNGQTNGNKSVRQIAKQHSLLAECNVGTLDVLNGNGNDKWFRRAGHFNGTFDAFAKIAKNEGLASLWSGLPPTLVMAIPATVIYFTVYDQMRERLNAHFNHDYQPIWVPVISGGFARIFAATTICPLEMIRTKMQSKKLSYLEVGQAVKNLINAQGMFSLWRGLSPTLLRDVPFSCIYWANYELYKQTFDQTEPSYGFSFLAGASAGTIAAIVTLPFDVVKTHRQIELGELEILREKRGSTVGKESSSTFNIMSRIYKQQGVKGLFSGIVPRVIKVAPACAVMISTYECGKAFFRSYNLSKSMT